MLGEILVSLGSITPEQQATVLARQAKLGLPFGECCIRLKLISRGDLAQALALQFGHLHPVSSSGSFGRELAMVSDPFGSYAEALRAVAYRLKGQWLQPDRNVIAVVSAEPEEGRSQLAANLAVAFSQAGMRTLLMDADLRAPRQHALFNVPQHPGFSRLLCGFAPEEVVRRLTDLPYLTLITAGPSPPNTLELLGRQEHKLLMQQASVYYEAVVVDTPPGSRFADAELIASAAGSALMVVRKNRTRQRKVRRLTKLLSKSGVQLAGTLMNTF
jgi:chain length determinant protein tyrosine kinase EpsG